ncbi:MAG: bifunctional demethylmenaquinone methyltransferase/2-methoxy-6-polyprenyl-1,4-benzoquinol methylase UbiE [Candidatus Sericytochromatia bacterium]
MKSTTREPERLDVWRMFDRIAGRYDLINRTLSMGIDISWRKQLTRMLPPRPGLRVLDLATGTADVPLTLCAETADVTEVVGMDLSEGMLAIGADKVAAACRQAQIRLEVGDAMLIPAPEQSFDAVTIAFGIRNVPDVSQTLREMLRVLNPGGYGLVLEFSTPALPGWRQAYLLYLRHVLPRIGALISGDSYAYRYLNQTIETFPYGQAFCDLMIEAGFRDVEALPLTGGIATIYRGKKMSEQLTVNS